jgi:predicted DNA-binding protein (MmcQ/YjbR family)
MPLTIGRKGGAGKPAERVLDQLRAFCLSLPGTTEVASWGHPNFRAGGRTFATFEFVRGRPSIAVLVRDGVQALLIDDERFFRTPYSANRGWVSVWVDGDFEWPFVRSLIKGAHRTVLPVRQRKHPAARKARHTDQGGRGPRR